MHRRGERIGKELLHASPDSAVLPAQVHMFHTIFLRITTLLCACGVMCSCVHVVCCTCKMCLFCACTVVRTNLRVMHSGFVVVGE